MTVASAARAAQLPESAAIGRATDRTAVLRLAAALAQFALLVVLVRQFHLESRTFFEILLLSCVAFPIHALLPVRFRWSMFAVLSLASVVLAFGMIAGAWLLGLGAILILLCHLPASFPLRVSGVLGMASILAAIRAGWLTVPVPPEVWPILGAMFMFRLAVYLYTLKNHDAPFSPARTVAYFFMLPNACFPLYPVVDYKAFTRSSFDGAPSAIYQTGLRMMLRGVVHLLLYRYVYYHLTLDVHELRNLGDLVQYLLSTFFLYLRVSGQFHLIVGILHLYGFRLPETHHLYYLASGFTDFWRRINIYWKDFMMKLVYYPSFFRFRRFGQRTAIVLATMVVFVVTWLLHSYQWFWLRGTFPLTWPDALFWSILAVLVVATTLREAGGSRRRQRKSAAWSLSLALRTTGTFIAICVLWSLWSAESVSDWLAMWRVARTVAPADIGLLGGLLAFGIAIGGIAWGAKDISELRPVDVSLRDYLRSSGTLAGVMGCLLLLGTTRLQTRLPGWLTVRLASVQESRLNARDAALEQRGYYENLDNVKRLNSQLWEADARRKAPPVNITRTEVNRPRTDFLLWDLRPSTTIQFRGHSFSTNRWGMRDRDYEVGKAPGTIRIALLGPSDVMGWGVGDGETFESLLEDNLNALRPAAAPRVEILNFGVHAYGLTQQLALLRDRVWTFQPDIVIITSHYSTESMFIRIHLARAVAAGIPIPDAYLREIARKAEVTSDVDQSAAMRELAPYGDSLVAWSVAGLGEEIRRHGARPVLLSLRFGIHPPDSTGALSRTARAAGFTFFDLSEVLPALGPDYFMGDEDHHPNTAGHRVLAERLYESLAQWDPRFARQTFSLRTPDSTGATR